MVYSAIGAAGPIPVAFAGVAPPITMKNAATFVTYPNQTNHCLGIATGDLMGTTTGSAPDGLPEVVVVIEPTASVLGKVSVFRNSGDCAADPPVNGLVLASGSPMALPAAIETGSPYDVRLHDMDLDSDLDIVATDRHTDANEHLDGYVVIYFNQGNGAFSVTNSVAIQVLPDTVSPHHDVTVWSLEVRDFGAHSYPDIAVASSALRQTGPHSFQTEPTVDLIYGDPLLSWTGSTLKQKIIVNDVLALPPGDQVHTDVTAISMGKTCLFGGTNDYAASFLEFDGVFVAKPSGTDPLTGLPTWGYTLVKAQPDNPPVRSSYGVALAKLRAGNVTKDIVTYANLQHDPGIGLSYDASLIRTNTDCTLAPDTATPTYDVLPTLYDPYGFTFGKIDANNSFDLIVACQHGQPNTQWNHGGIAIYQGKLASGGFFDPGLGDTGTIPKYFFPSTENGAPKPCFVIVDDMNDDGCTDIITSNAVESKVGVLINKSCNATE